MPTNTYCSCSSSTVRVSSHLECIVAEEMAGEATYNHMMLCRRLSSLFTRVDLPFIAASFPCPPHSSSLVFILQIPSLLCTCPKDANNGSKNGPEAKCLQLWRCECEEMCLTGMNSARKVRLRVQTNKMQGEIFRIFCSSLLNWYFNCWSKCH